MFLCSKTVVWVIEYNIFKIIIKILYFLDLIMSKINCFNVLKMIFDELDPSLKVETPITIEEMNLKDQIKGLLF